MKLKKIAAALLAVSMLPLSACQDSHHVQLDPSSPTAIEIWHYYNGAQKEAFDSLVTEFNETVGREKGIVVEAFSQGNVNDLIQKVMDAADKKVGASEIPDVFAAYVDTAYAVDQRGLVASLDPYLSEEDLDQYVDAYIEEGRFDQEGNLKIFPIAKSTEVFMLNKTDWDEFASATGASLDSLSTMEGVTQTAAKYYEWSDGKAFFGRDAVANLFITGCKQLGHEIFSVKDGKVTFDTDEATLRKIWDNYYVPMVSGHFGAYGKFRSDDVKTGDLIALVGSTSGSAYFPTQVTLNDTESYDIETLVLPTPIFAGADDYAVQQGAGMVVTKTDEKREYASVEFLKWFTDTQRNLQFSTGSGYLPVKKEANSIEALEAADLDDATDALRKTLTVAIDVVNHSTLYTNKAFENGTKARNVLEYCLPDKIQADLEQIQSQVDGGMSHEDAVAQFTTEENFQNWLTDFRQQLEKSIQ